MTVANRLMLCLILAVLVALPGTAARAQGPAVAAAEVNPHADPFIDRGTVMAACGVGVAWGAVSLATYPLWKWTKDAGALLSMGVMVWRGVLGCYYGVIAGVTLSAGSSTIRMIGDWWKGPDEPAASLQGTS